MPQKRVNTATLIRGDQFSFRPFVPLGSERKEPVRFRYGEPVVIRDPEVLRQLENAYDTVEDSDGEIYEKPRFKIERNVPLPDTEYDPYKGEMVRRQTSVSTKGAIKRRRRVAS